jgi:hypothetical protein
MGSLESLRVQSIQVYKICGKKQDAFLPLIYLFLPWRPLESNMEVCKKNLLKLAQCAPWLYASSVKNNQNLV